MKKKDLFQRIGFILSYWLSRWLGLACVVIGMNEIINNGSQIKIIICIISSLIVFGIWGNGFYNITKYIDHQIKKGM